MVNDLTVNNFFPKSLTLFGDVSLERVSCFHFPKTSQIFFTKNFAGSLSGKLIFVTDLNLLSLKKSQIGYAEGILAEAFNMLAQKLLLNLCEQNNLSTTNFPSQVNYNVSYSSMHLTPYRLSMLNGYCHCGIEILQGSNL